jgi:hypothetical protein
MEEFLSLPYHSVHAKDYGDFREANHKEPFPLVVCIICSHKWKLKIMA